MGKYKRGTTLYDYCINEDKKWILEQFDDEKNAPLTTKDFSKSSDACVWFKFKECGHSCKQRIADKTGKNSKKCPTCLNRNGIGKSLSSEYPEYAKMFMTSKNGISPDLVSYQNGKIYWWECPRCRNQFMGKVSDVVNGKRVCNECSNKKRSYPEYCLAYYLLQIDKTREINKNLEGYKFDFFLPKYQLIIEYDGYPWHNKDIARRNDVLKDNICNKHKLKILRIRDSRLNDNKMLTSSIWYFKYDNSLIFLQKLNGILSDMLGTNINMDINVTRDSKEIKIYQLKLDKEESLLSCIPDLYDYIDPDNEKNGKPEYVCNESHKIRFWLRHPIYKNLKWSITAHKLFQRKSPYTQWINMCVKLISKYPELEEQAVKYGNNIREQSYFTLKCSCGKFFDKTYAALMGKSKVTMCSECLKKFRINNLKNKKS